MNSGLDKFWLNKKLEDLDKAQWESLCDHCGLCCSMRLEDEDTGEILNTNIVCRYYDNEETKCTCYKERQIKVPECVVLDPQNSKSIPWLPPTCAYHLVARGFDLPDWHPLITGDPNSTHKMGISIKESAISEALVKQEDWHLFTD